MKKGQRLTMEQLRGLVENEGLGYAVQCHTGPERMPTPEIEELWRTAGDALQKLHELIMVDE